MFTVNRNPSTSDLHKFGVAMLIGFAALGGIAWIAPAIRAWDTALLDWRGGWNQMSAIVAWVLGSSLFAASRAPEPIARRVYVAWMSGATAMGIVMSTLVLTIMFVILLPPFSLIVRMGDPLRKRLTAGGTYWEEYKGRDGTLERLRRPF